jgi:hypothetical protein
MSAPQPKPTTADAGIPVESDERAFWCWRNVDKNIGDRIERASAARQA